MKALTVRQPWADAIAHLGKRQENRTRRTNYHGPLLIHAAKQTDEVYVGTDKELLPDVRGAVIATAVLVSSHWCASADDVVECDSQWAEPGLWHWDLTDVHPLEHPVYCRGALGLWTPSPDLLRDVRAAGGQW